MDSSRLGNLARAFAGRHTRRVTTRLAAAGQDATPAIIDPTDDPTFMFVQEATGGTFAANPDAGASAGMGTPVPGGGASYLLTLEGHTGSTVYFSDRPGRIFGTAPTQRFLDGLGFAASNPPNAALVTADADGTEDVMVVELFAPQYDRAAGSVTYGVNVLGDYEGGLDFVASRQRDDEFASSFGMASLFIDDCSDADPLNCWKTYHLDPIGNLGTRGMCWDWDRFDCVPCDGGIDGTSAECNARFPDCDNECTTV
jgi:hypothetical protein